MWEEGRGLRWMCLLRSGGKERKARARWGREDNDEKDSNSDIPAGLRTMATAVLRLP